MRLKKVITCSALSIALLLSASSASASNSSADSNKSQKIKTPQAELNTIHLKANTQKEAIICLFPPKRCKRG
ncbi:hypothetical protein ACTHP2_06695 [Bacillus altitudinis]|uniref:hypothetical protein n=1 Tax=Bacillus TaxID=1386 RepID=UPI001F3BA3FC|nr:hypothetical protein [Bacillus altitudinis]MCY7627715.1 hypothetical protein [Bacillus altitudinis]MDX2363595.1 hypothetical protein [Bacillus altitudinis]